MFVWWYLRKGACFTLSHCHLFCLTAPLPLLSSFIFFSPSILQVAHSLPPLPPHCSLHLSRHPRLPPTTPPPGHLHRSGSARCPCWRKTPPTLTWSPTRKTHTCSVPSPPPRVRHLSSRPPVSLSHHFVDASVCHPSTRNHFLIGFHRHSVKCQQSNALI